MSDILLGAYVCVESWVFARVKNSDAVTGIFKVVLTVVSGSEFMPGTLSIFKMEEGEWLIKSNGLVVYAHESFSANDALEQLRIFLSQTRY